MILVMLGNGCSGKTLIRNILCGAINMLVLIRLLKKAMNFIQILSFREILHQFIGYNLNEHQLICLIRKYRAEDKVSPTQHSAVLFSVLQGELKRINFLNFEALLKGLEEKEDNLIKEGVKSEKNGMLPKEITRRTLVALLGTAKSQLRIHNVNHLIDALAKR